MLEDNRSQPIHSLKPHVAGLEIPLKQLFGYYKRKKSKFLQTEEVNKSPQTYVCAPRRVKNIALSRKHVNRVEFP